MADTDWARAWKSLWDVVGAAEKWWSIVLRLIGVVALVLAIPLVDLWSDGDFLGFGLTGRILWVASVIVAFLFGAQAVYVKRRALDQMRRRARIGARLPQSQRERVQRIKEIGSRIAYKVSPHKDLDEEGLKKLTGELEKEGAALMEHLSVTVAVSNLLLAVRLEIVGRAAAPEGFQFYEEDVGRSYKFLVRACNLVLEEFPQEV